MEPLENYDFDNERIYFWYKHKLVSFPMTTFTRRLTNKQRIVWDKMYYEKRKKVLYKHVEKLVMQYEFNESLKDREESDDESESEDTNASTDSEYEY